MRGKAFTPTLSLAECSREARSIEKERASSALESEASRERPSQLHSPHHPDAETVSMRRVRGGNSGAEQRSESALWLALIRQRRRLPPPPPSSSPSIA